jgi:RNA polymerase sigma-70 factor (ECF subfamily)
VRVLREVDAVAPEPEGDRPEPPDFTRLFQAECSYVWTSLRRLGIRDRDLEDLVHEVFLVVHRHLGDYDPRRPIRPWLFGISFRVAAAYRRLARTHRELVSDQIEAVDPEPSAEDRVATKQEQELVMRALDMLDLDRRALILMHDFDELTMPEIAEIIGVPLNTAYSRLRLAREQFTAACRRLQASAKPVRKGGLR